jgi:N-methylhydantoinase B
VRWGKVSVAGAERDYGVLITGLTDGAGGPVVDVPASDTLRAGLRSERDAEHPSGTAFFDRGPGYTRLSGGISESPYDRI